MSKLHIKRALINGKRRFVVYLFDLVDHLEELTDYDKSCRDELVETLKDMIKEGKFRDNIDWTYNAKRHVSIHAPVWGATVKGKITVLRIGKIASGVNCGFNSTIFGKYAFD